MASSVDPDEMHVASHLGLHCLLRPVSLNIYCKCSKCILFGPRSLNFICAGLVLVGQENKMMLFYNLGNVYHFYHDGKSALNSSPEPRKFSGFILVCIIRMRDILNLFNDYFKLAFWPFCCRVKFASLYMYIYMGKMSKSLFLKCNL